MIHTIDSAVAGFLMRALQVVVESSLYLLIGLLTAGALRAMVGPERVRRLFGAGRWTGPLRSWAAATTILPVCALGVLPVLRELRRAGVSRPAVLTFALATPMFNPISLIYGVSYLGPRVLAVLILGTFIVSVGVGVIWAHLRPGDVVESPPEEPGRVPPVGLRRLVAAGVHAAREATGPTLRDVAAGVLGAGLISALFSAPYLAASMFAGDPLAIPRMAAVAPLSYVTPDQGVVMIPEMLKFRQSAGAMLIVITLGVGMTLGHVTWLTRSYGSRAAAVWLALTIGLALAVACAVEGLVTPVGTANVDNDHFTVLANPLEDGGLAALPRVAGRYVAKAGTFRWVTCGALLALVLAGLTLRRLGARGTFEAFLVPPEVSADADRPASPWSRPLPPRLVAAVALVGFLAVAAAGTYTYYPSPSVAFREMQIIKADFYGELGASSVAAPLHHLDLWERQAAKLPTGALIRLAPPSDETRRRTEELRDGLMMLRMAVERGRRDEAKTLFLDVQALYSRCQSSYGIH